MTCAICNSDDCELNYTEDDLYLSNPFIHLGLCNCSWIFSLYL